MEDKRILWNAICTPDGTILESRHGHDYVSYTDKNGQYYAVDGGRNYLKRSFDKPDYSEISIYDTGDHDLRRTYLKWGVNYTKEMVKLPRTEFKSIKSLDTEHIQAILDTQTHIDSFYKEVFKDELEYRKNEKKEKV